MCAVVLLSGVMYTAHYKTVAVIASAFLLAIAHCMPTYCSWCVFIFLIPLFSVGIFFNSPSFSHGFLWGIIFFSVQLRALIYVIFSYGQTASAYLLSVFIVMYWAFHTGIWFWCAHIASRVWQYSLIWRTACWVITTYWFFWYVYSYGYLPLGLPYGYFAALFWLPLASQSLWLSALPLLGIHGISLAVIIISATFVLWIHTNTTLAGCSTLGITFIFLYGWCLQPMRIPAPAWIEYTCWLSPKKMVYQHPYNHAHAITQALRDALNVYPQARIFLLPESTCPFALNEYQHIAGWWWNDLLPQDAWVVLGGHRRQAKKLFNTLYVLQNVGITLHYDKSLLFPGIEYTPSFWNRLKDLISAHFCVREQFSAANSCDTHSNQKVLDAWCLCVPVICSELFLDTSHSTLQCNTMRLCIVNDRWFIAEYMQELMYLYAKVRAMGQGYSCLYISHTRGVYIDALGCEINLKH